MARKLNDKEKECYIENRDFLHAQLTELQADLEDLGDMELIECRMVMLDRVNECLKAILETDEDNVYVGKKYTFNTTDTDLEKYNGTEVEVIRPLTEDEADISDVGNMYKVRFADGFETDAFEDELIA